MYCSYWRQGGVSSGIASALSRTWRSEVAAREWPTTPPELAYVSEQARLLSTREADRRVCPRSLGRFAASFVEPTQPCLRNDGDVRNRRLDAIGTVSEL